MGYLSNDSDSEESSESKEEEAKEQKAKPKLTSAQWWRSEELGRRPDEVLDTVVRNIENDQSARYTAYREYERLFGATTRHEGDESLSAVISDDLTQNELQNTIETLWAQVFKNKIVPGISANEAEWDEWNRAKAYSRWLKKT